MRATAAVLLIPCAVWAQTVQRYEYDPSGNRIAGPTTFATDGQRTERVQSINGRRVPIEKVEERVLRSDGTERVVERVIQRFNPEGQPVASIRVVVEEKQLGGGSSSVRTTVYQGSRIAERTTEHVSRAGGSGSSETVVERPSIDGTLATAERRQKVEQKTDGSLTSSGWWLVVSAWPDESTALAIR